MRKKKCRNIQEMLMGQNGVEGRTKKEKKNCVTRARLSLPQSISLRNPQEMDAPVIPRETQRKEEEGRQPEIRQGKPISMSFPNWSIGAKLPPLREMQCTVSTKMAKSRKQNKRLTETGRNGSRIFLIRTDKFRPRNKKTREMAA